MTMMASQITSLTVVYSTVYSDADQRKHQSSASLAFLWGIHRDRWIPRTKGQLRGKCFHLMTSSWDFYPAHSISYHYIKPVFIRHATTTDARTHTCVQTWQQVCMHWSENAVAWCNFRHWPHCELSFLTTVISVSVENCLEKTQSSRFSVYPLVVSHLPRIDEIDRPLFLVISRRVVKVFIVTALFVF